MRKRYRLRVFKNEAEWLKNRKIGGSGCSSLFNANPYQSKLDVYCALTSAPNENDEEEKDTFSQAYGKALEPLLIKMVEENFKGKFKVIKTKKWSFYERVDKPFMTASLDSILQELDTKDKWVLEIKTHIVQSEEDYEKNWKYGLPQNYYMQTCHYQATLVDFKGAILVAKLQWLDYSTGLPIKEEIRYYFMPREKHLKDIELVEQVETEFMENNVNKRIPPNFTL